MSSNTNIDQVAASNQKLGAFPIVTLASGQKVPTGTVATLVHNIRLYDTLVAKRILSQDEEATVAKLEGEMKVAVPVLWKSGLLDIFPPEEWVEGGKQGSEGRMFVGRCALEGQEEEK